MQNFQIRKAQITASSKVESSPYGRLGHARKSWCPPESFMEYLQVDLIQIHTVTYIATQGSSKKDAWVTSYYIEYSADGQQWHEYKDADRSRRVRN